MYVLVCICIHLVSERAPTRRLPPTSPSLAGWPGGCGERGTCAAISITPPWQLLGWRPCWKDCCCGWLLLDLLAILTMLCSVAVTSFMLPTPSAPRRASLAGGSGTGGAPTAAAERHRCWTGAGHMYVLVCIGLLSTPLAADFGPGPEAAAEVRVAGRGVCFSTLLAANFGPGLDGAVEGALPWCGVCHSTFHSMASRR